MLKQPVKFLGIASILFLCGIAQGVPVEFTANLSGPADPFDPDTPYWIVPNAFALARYLGIDRGRVVEIVAAEPVAPRDAPKSGAPLS